jgi:hypothetical protein
MPGAQRGLIHGRFGPAEPHEVAPAGTAQKQSMHRSGSDGLTHRLQQVTLVRPGGSCERRIYVPGSGRVLQQTAGRLRRVAGALHRHSRRGPAIHD